MHRGAEMDPSSSLLRKMSRKGSSHPTASPLRTVCKGATVEMVVKGVNQVGGSAVKVSSTYLLQNRGGVWKEDSASCSTSSITRFATTTDTVDSIAVLWIYRYTLPSRAGQGPPGKVGEGGADVIHRETGPVWKRWVIHQMVLWQRVVEGKEEEDVEAKSIQ